MPLADSNFNQFPHLKSDIQKLIEEFGDERNSLLSVLLGVQDKYHHVPEEAISLIADRLNVHPIYVQAEISFYHFLSNKPKGKFVINMCQTISCKMLDAEQVSKQFEKELGIKFGETTEDGYFTLEWTNCLGMCDQAPALLINNVPYTKVKAEDVHKIITDCRERTDK